MKCCENEDFEPIKIYDPKPKNSDGSTRWFLYRWDDGKDGYRKLIKCKSCGAYFLVQCYKLNKFSENANTVYEDWFAVQTEALADKLNREHTGPQLERKYTAVYSGIQGEEEVNR